MRKDDDVEIPSLTLDDDELNQRAATGTESQAAKQRLNPPPAHPVGSQVAAKKPSLAGVYFLFLLVIGGVGAGGYWLWKENQSLRQELIGARNQISDLDSQLLATDASTNELGATVEETLKNHNSEIRKLWVVSNERNKANISENAQALKALQEKASQLRESISTQAKLVAVQGDAFNEIESGYNNLVDTVAAVEKTQREQSAVVSGTQASIEKSEKARLELSQKLEQLSKRLSQLSDRVAGIETQVRSQGIQIQTLNDAPAELPNELGQRLQRNEEAIQSIDQFRPQVLREINSLKSQIRQLSLEASLSAGE